MNLKEAKHKADEIVRLLNPHCELIHIAGSIRREKAVVKDIEIVCLPRIEQSLNLFGDVEYQMADSEFQQKVYNAGAIIKGSPTGRYCQINLGEINLDLFMPQSHDYYRQYAIRTGSAEYSAKVIATGWRKMGWVGTENGLRLQNQCVEKKLPDGKSKWICEIRNPELPPVWQSEEKFFEWIDVAWINPHKR